MCASEFSDFSLNLLKLNFKMEGNVKDSFNIAGSFELNKVNDGMNILSEDVTIKVGTSEMTIPAGSFYLEYNLFKCNETINGCEVQAVFEDLGSDTWSFAIRAIDVDLTGTANPDSIILTVGNDWGQASERLEGQLSLNGGVVIEP